MPGFEPFFRLFASSFCIGKISHQQHKGKVVEKQKKTKLAIQTAYLLNVDRVVNRKLEVIYFFMISTYLRSLKAISKACSCTQSGDSIWKVCPNGKALGEHS